MSADNHPISHKTEPASDSAVWKKSLEIWQFVLALGATGVALSAWGARLPSPAELDRVERELKSHSERLTRVEENSLISVERGRLIRDLADKLDRLKQTVEDTRRDVAVLRARAEKGE